MLKICCFTLKYIELDNQSIRFDLFHPQFTFHPLFVRCLICLNFFFFQLSCFLIFDIIWRSFYLYVCHLTHHTFYAYWVRSLLFFCENRNQQIKTIFYVRSILPFLLVYKFKFYDNFINIIFYTFSN